MPVRPVTSALNALTRRSLLFRAEGAITIIEILVVIMVIFILAALVLAASSYVQNKGARARAETEIAAMSAALEVTRPIMGFIRGTQRR